MSNLEKLERFPQAFYWKYQTHKERWKIKFKTAWISKKQIISFSLKRKDYYPTIVRFRSSEAPAMIANGSSETIITTHMAEKYGISRRQDRWVTLSGMGLIVEDFDEINIERQQMVVTLIVNLQEAIQ